jgi:hypothetical protein
MGAELGEHDAARRETRWHGGSLKIEGEGEDG